MTDSADAGPPPIQSSLTLAAIFGLLLLGLTVWAFGGPTTERHTTAAGIRVGPTEAYNPVLDGGPLPDGFRQLLPRDAIKPVYDPQFVAASQAGWSSTTDVIGIRVGDEAKAYPVSFLSGRELVIDELGGEPLLISW